MKNLKKLISVIIAVIMIVGSFATVSAADYKDVESTDSFYKAIKVLSGLGIVNGDDEGNFNPDNDIKRSEMIKLVCYAMGEQDIATASASNAFTDVAANHWAAGYIAWGVNRGIINGMGDGTFAPDASVSYQDAVVMIMRALGYDRIAQRAENGGYPTGYLKLASQYGVLKDAGYDNQAAAPREVVAQLIYNALTAPLVDVSYYGVSVEDDRYVIYNGKNGYALRTLLTFSNEVFKVKAEITDTPKASSGLIDKNGEYKVKLDIVSDYDYDGAVEAEIGATPTVYVGETEAANLLGSTVEAYIAESEELNDYVLLAVVADAKSVVEETLVAADVDFVSFTTSPNVFKYLDANEKEVEIDIASTYTVYFNGKAITPSTTNLAAIGATDVDGNDDTLSEMFADFLVNVADEITFMGPKNGDYNKIFVTDYKYFQVLEVMADEKFVKVYNGISDVAIDLDAESRGKDTFAYNLYDAEGKAIDLEDIAEDDILNVIVPLTGSAYDESATALEYMDIYVTDAKAEGRVDASLGNGEYTVNGEAYVFMDTPELGDEGVFFLTIDGKVFAFDADSTISKNYGFIVAHHAEADFNVNTHYLKVFKADGTFENFVVAPTANVYVAFSGNSNTYGKFVAKRSDGTQDSVAGYLNTFLAPQTALDDAKAYVQARVMTYSLNSEGEIKEMRFIGPAGSRFDATYVDGGKYYGDVDVFAGYDLNDDSVLFVAPFTTDNDGKYIVDQDKLKISSFNLMDEDKAGGYDAYVFGYDDDDFLGAAVVTEEITSSMKYAHLAVVQSSSTGLNAEGDPVVKYTFVQAGETTTLAVDADASVADMTAGDVFRYTVDVDGEIDAVELVYDFSGSTFDDQGYTYATLDDNDIAIVYGEISEIKSGKMTLADVDGKPAAPDTKLTLNASEANTYASIDEARVAGGVNVASGIKALSGAGNLKASYGSNHFHVIAIVGENNRFEDCVMIIK